MNIIKSPITSPIIDAFTDFFLSLLKSEIIKVAKEDTMVIIAPIVSAP